jgi:hypothetical protein
MGATRPYQSMEVISKVNAQRSAVRSIAWLGLADSQTKCNTDDVWREGKKKGLEGEEEWPEGGDGKVSATGWGRTERAGGAAAGGAEAGGDRAGAWAASQHGVARTETQRGALRWLVSRAARATTGARATLSLAAQQPVWARALEASGRVVAGRVEPRTSLRALALERRAGDQPRDHLPAYLAGSEKWEAHCINICAVRARAAGNATDVTTVEGAWREKE